ncbi:hypothetical protein [Bordetella genomosp. 9]|uniref:hypothetical protein n=1 Tax=Bordetella genomosp. 9 TaxID=1416803 RepID=UPI0018DFF8B5|nr:hypothetical protein [Bordetella genomosp. 9]
MTNDESAKLGGMPAESRAAFEAAAEAAGKPRALVDWKLPIGRYADDAVEFAWQVWLRSRILPAASEAGAVPMGYATESKPGFTAAYFDAAIMPPGTPVYAAAPAQPEKQAGHELSVSLTGAELAAALDYVAPDRDPDQMEAVAVIRYGDGHSGRGYYCWLDDCPEEGSILLGGEIAAPPAPIQQAGSDVQLVPTYVVDALKAWTGSEPSVSALARAVDRWLDPGAEWEHDRPDDVAPAAQGDEPAWRTPGGIPRFKSRDTYTAPAAQCVACEGKPSGDNVPCAVCGAPAAQGDGDGR